MKRSFLATAALVAVFAFAANTATAQQTFISEDFSTAFGTVSPNWSVILLSGDDLGISGWRYDNIGNHPTTAPFAVPFATSDADVGGPGIAFSSALTSQQFDFSTAASVLIDFDYQFRQLGAGTATLEVFDGSTWNVASSLAGNATGAGQNSHVAFNLTALAAGASNGRIRFVHTAGWDWWYAVDNITLEEPAPIDVACGTITAPVIDPTDCIGGLTAAETISVDYINAGSGAITAGSLVQIDILIDGLLQLTEFDIPAANIPGGGTVTSFTTVGTVDMSALGAHTLTVTITYAGDGIPGNNSCTLSYSNPGAIPVALGYFENFDTLPSNNGAFTPTIFDVPAGWENAQDDAATIAGNVIRDWAPNDGTTGSNQGPSGDNTTGAGIYMFMEDSPSQTGDIELRGPCLDPTGSVGSPSLQFAHFSHAPAGDSSDNILEIDIINETTGGTVTLSVASLPGYGDNNWHTVLVDLSAFGTDLVRPQFRCNNLNGTFTDDVSIDDVRYFDAIQPNGQAPQPGNAVFDINNAANSLGQIVSSGANGPYAANVSVGGNMNMTWSGQNNGIMLCLFGPANDNIANFGPTIGQLDIGQAPIVGGIPSSIFVFGDGNLALTSLFHAFFFTGPAGTGGINFQVSPVFAPGPLTRFQCVMNPAGLFFISNAVDVTVL